MQLLSSLIISPRSAHAFYKGVDDLCLPTDTKSLRTVEGKDVSVVYPFYQYGEYDKYDPDNAEYYLPGSSIKGAFLHKKEEWSHCMADDVVIPNNKRIVLHNLWKAQHLEDTDINKATFDLFFKNVGIEMIEYGTELKGEFYLEDTIQFSDILKDANKKTKDKMEQMYTYIQDLREKPYSEALQNNLKNIENRLTSILHDNDVILLGGYKGLLHSMMLKSPAETKGGLFIDSKTMLPHGLVRIKFE